MSLAWTSANGSTWPLDGSDGVTVVDTAEGIFSIPLDMIVEQRVGADGGVLISQRRAPRRVMLSFLLAEPSEGAGVLSLWTEFYAALTAGGTLSYEGVSATRELRQVLLEGADRSMLGRDLRYAPADRFTATFIALDPWWYGSAESQTINLGSPTAWNAAIPWNSAIPWNGGSAVSVGIIGDTSALPVWTITGATTELLVANSAGSSWTWIDDLASGAYGTVDHRPGSRGPRLGSDLYGDEESDFGLWYLLDNSSTLDWGLAVGDNNLVVSAAGTDGSTTLEMWYEPRYLGPG